MMIEYPVKSRDYPDAFRLYVQLYLFLSATLLCYQLVKYCTIVSIDLLHFIYVACDFFHFFKCLCNKTKKLS